MPIFFLSGALFPLTGIPSGLAIATRINPLTYGIDGLRGALVQAAYFGLATDIGIMAIIAAVFLMIGARAFARIQI
jgi:ABC-2 type transport system permease protein